MEKVRAFISIWVRLNLHIYCSREGNIYPTTPNDKNECVGLVIVILLKYSWSREQHCPVDWLSIFKKLESNVDSIQTRK